MLLNNIVSAFILPPGLFLVLFFIAFLLWQYMWQRLAKIIMVTTLLGFYLVSTPWGANHLIRPLLNDYPPLNLEALAPQQAQAIIVLGSGRAYGPEYGGITISRMGLIRLRYAALLAKQTHLPLLVSGGSSLLQSTTEAVIMQNILEDEFDIPVQWVESTSRNTQENAKYSADILLSEGIKDVYLVTNAWHMRRAIMSFEHAGLQPIAAPTGYNLLLTEYRFKEFLPSMQAFFISRLALREYIGVQWYKHTAL